jgi:hypothetical protein
MSSGTDQPPAAASLQQLQLLPLVLPDQKIDATWALQVVLGKLA